ncbi:hypothetical protein [Actinoalloteichus caeruleus]|uniref:hypothetical protein n=1 Tax=Actinoalloteichus cyanogriseus TaxID=2893586 RepID=UPI003BB8A353
MPRNGTDDNEPEDELSRALGVVKQLGRAGSVEHLPDGPTASTPRFRPFWAEFVDQPHSAPELAPTAPAPTAGTPQFGSPPPGRNRADLVITSLSPTGSPDQQADLVALFAARRLSVGGLLVVLTRCDGNGEELSDPTGPLVAAAQNADLLYLQHIVALHAPVRDDHFLLANLGGGDREAGARYRALVRGLPAPHRRIHSDVLVFAQPHDHRPIPQLARATTDERGTR